MKADTLGEGLSDQDRVLLVFGYLGPLSLVALVATRREFVKWHAKQGLALFGLLVVGYVALSAVQAIVDRLLWAVFGELFRMASWLTVVGVVVAMLVCVIRALEGERFRLPLVGDLADRL